MLRDWLLVLLGISTELSMLTREKSRFRGGSLSRSKCDALPIRLPKESLLADEEGVDLDWEEGPGLDCCGVCC